MAGLSDLWQQLVSSMNITGQQVTTPAVYAQNRWTQAPTYIGPTAATNAPNTGLTQAPGNDLTGMDRALLTLSAPDSQTRSFLAKGSNTQNTHGNIILADTNPVAARHESVHSVLDNAGVGSNTYMDTLDSLGAVGDGMRYAFNRSNVAGTDYQELPAYMVESKKFGTTPIPGITPEMRDAYLDQFSKTLEDRHGKKVADTFRRLQN